MSHAEIKANTKKGNQFAQVDTLGAFDFYTAIVSLDAVTTHDISELRATFDIAAEGVLDAVHSLTPDRFKGTEGLNFNPSVPLTP